MASPPEIADSHAAKLRAARVSVIVNVGLTVVKIAVGVLTGSVSVAAEGAHSLTDVFSSSLSLYSVSRADLPPDAEHPFGHGKIENLSALFQGLFLLGTALFILREALMKFLAQGAPEKVGAGIAVMLVSGVVNLFVIRYLSPIAKAADSDALRAAAQDHRADIFAAAGVLLGLLLVSVTGKGFFDPLLAAAVACLIAHGAFQLVRDGVSHLLDAALPPEEIATVRRILETDPHVLAYHKLRTRKAGAFREIDAHVLMDDSLSLLVSHGFTERLEDELRRAFPEAAIHLHTEPYHEELRHQLEDHGKTTLDYAQGQPHPPAPSPSRRGGV